MPVPSDARGARGVATLQGLGLGLGPRLALGLALGLALAIPSPGCRGGSTSPSAPAPTDGGGAAAAATATPIAVRADASGLLFRYYDAEARQMKTVRRLDDVPPTARARVIVHEEATLLDYQAGQPLTVADLRAPNVDGTFPTELVAPESFGAALPATARTLPTATATGGAPAAASDSARGGEVILFSTDWCPHCRSAREFLSRRGVRFTERDVEKDPKARPLLAELGQKAGVDPALLTSVPVLWVKGRLLLGFDEKQVAALLGP